MTQQKFSAANNWTVNTIAVSLANNATFNITQYALTLNPGGNNQPGLVNGTAAGSAFGENINFTLNPNLARTVESAGRIAGDRALAAILQPEHGDGQWFCGDTTCRPE